MTNEDFYNLSQKLTEALKGAGLDDVRVNLTLRPGHKCVVVTGEFKAVIEEPKHD